ncbi:tetratricopeptide repeat protein [Permianibacter aggregans]|uniref:histidine kinase n=2 Tax=Permianibacter aggregans TaxID=1510150 RepID=A0A4R6UMV5_9GAMM|nr:tetratricopeptide repeat protein [Permianibacter aggregans]TDQ47526.1 tetratricopeptide repeat protein [Permianibacter aggregans]
MPSFDVRPLLVGFFFVLMTLPVLANGECQSIDQTDASRAVQYADQVRLNSRNDPATALQVASEALEYFQQHCVIAPKADVLNESAYALYFQSRYPEALVRAKEAEVFAQDYRLLSSVARAKTIQANVLQSVGEYSKAIGLYNEAIELYQRDKGNRASATEGETRILNNIANTYFMARQYDYALKYYHQFGGRATQPENQAAYALGVANVMAEKAEYPEAERHYREALQLYTKAGDLLGQELAMNGLSRVLAEEKNFEEALSFNTRAFESMERGGRQYNQVSILNGRAKIQMEMGRHQQAFLTLDAALKVAQRHGQKSAAVDVLEYRSQLHQRLGDDTSALRDMQAMLRLQSELLNERSSQQLAVMQAYFDVQEKNREIELLTASNRVKELELKQQNAIWLATVGAILFATMIIFFLFYRRTQKRLLREHELVSDKLRELDKVKDQVLLNTSHELRTPLNGIIGMSQLLLADASGELSEEVREQINVIESCGQRLLHLVQDILDYSQLQMGRLRVSLKPVDAGAVVRHACNLVKGLAEEKQLRLHVDMDEALPLVTADESRLHQILLNLLGNAIKFSRRGDITISAKHDADGVLISVQDQGPGIPTDKLQHIFNPFEQVDGSATRRGEGSGLGLPITRELLRLHGSEIQVQSVENRGSTFSFRLPAAGVESLSDQYAKAVH